MLETGKEEKDLRRERGGNRRRKESFPKLGKDRDLAQHSCTWEKEDVIEVPVIYHSDSEKVFAFMCFIRVCVYVCPCVCIYACVSFRLWMCTCVYCVCIRACVYVCVYICVYL